MKGKTNELLAARDNLLVAQGAGLRKGEMVILRAFHQMHHLLQLFPRFSGLTLQALRQDHGQQIGVCSHCPFNRSRVSAGRTGGDQAIIRQHQCVAHHFDQILMGNRNVARSQESNPLGASLLNRGQFL